MHLDFKYADLLDDLAFKLVFGQESTKNVMIEFLNLVISDRTIVDVEFADKEVHPNLRDKKTSIYDLLCLTDDGSRIIVELQKRKQDSYAERMLYYSMHQILKQVESGVASFDFCPIYVVSILNFTLDQNNSIADIKTVYRLLEGMYFCLKNMPQLKERPLALKHGVFDTIFSISELLVMDEDTRDKIIENMTTERDLKNQFEYARKVAIAEGMAEGRAEGLELGRAEGMALAHVEVAKNMLAMGLDVDTISKATGLSVDQINSL